MSVIIEANYSKKLGLPNYSSHQYSVTLRTEVSDLSQIERESAKLYALLQSSVDRELQEVGFVPGEAQSVTRAPSQPVRNQKPLPQVEEWKCSEKQRELIVKIVEEHGLQNEIEDLSMDRFSLPVRKLNKLQASGLIDELLKQYGKGDGSRTSRGNGNRRTFQQGGTR